MPKLELPYEVKPHKVSQPWGNYDPVYLQFGFDWHNGEDCLPGKDSKVYAPFAYEVVWAKWMPNCGGNVLGIVSQDQYDGPKGPAYVLIDFLHLEAFKVKVGAKGKRGDLVAISDNTGFSTGPHLHTQYRWVTKKNGKFQDVEKNRANNSFDPEPYRTGTYAVDLPIVEGLIPATLKIAQEIPTLPKKDQPYFIEILSKVVSEIKRLLITR